MDGSGVVCGLLAVLPLEVVVLGVVLGLAEDVLVDEVLGEEVLGEEVLG